MQHAQLGYEQEHEDADRNQCVLMTTEGRGLYCVDFVDSVVVQFDINSAADQ